MGSIYRNIEEMESGISDLQTKAAEFREQSEFATQTPGSTYSEGAVVKKLRSIEISCHYSMAYWANSADSLATFLQKDVLKLQEADAAGNAD